MPIRLKADGEKVTVSRLFGALEIPLSEVISVGPISKSDIDGSIRTFGSGGFFGYLGRFRNKTLGRYTMYATELKHLVLVRTRQKKYLFSCTRPEEFVAYVRARLKQ
ncbi:PH domain-containing protein [uncultured Rikenella sp.]|nr:PH domain-containing protein [uncultured Rikenella sp.]